VLAKAGFQRTGEAVLRYSLARGGEAVSVPYAAQLGADCDLEREGYMRAA
jgi:hypothetical protein